MFLSLEFRGYDYSQQFRSGLEFGFPAFFRLFFLYPNYLLMYILLTYVRITYLRTYIRSKIGLKHSYRGQLTQLIRRPPSVAIRVDFIKGSENTRADTLSKKPEYLGNKTYPSYAILKAEPDGLVFNTIKLTIISRLTGSNQTIEIQVVYAKNIATILNEIANKRRTIYRYTELGYYITLIR